MPRTPRAGRPIDRTSSSSKRIAMPLCVARNTIWLPSVIVASTSSSSLSMPIAIIPRDITFEKSFSGVFFTVPCRVTKKMYLPSSVRSRTVMIARTCSPGCRFNRLAIDLPLPAAPTSGISYTFSQYTRPVFVKHSRYACVESTSSCATKSSSRVFMPIRPVPPRFCCR